MRKLTKKRLFSVFLGFCPYFGDMAAAKAAQRRKDACARLTACGRGGWGVAGMARGSTAGVAGGGIDCGRGVGDGRCGGKCLIRNSGLDAGIQTPRLPPPTSGGMANGQGGGDSHKPWKRSIATPATAGVQSLFSSPPPKTCYTPLNESFVCVHQRDGDSFLHQPSTSTGENQ